jgi:hypothetical protein
MSQNIIINDEEYRFLTEITEDTGKIEQRHYQRDYDRNATAEILFERGLIIGSNFEAPGPEEELYVECWAMTPTGSKAFMSRLSNETHDIARSPVFHSGTVDELIRLTALMKTHIDWHWN